MTNNDFGTELTQLHGVIRELVERLENNPGQYGDMTVGDLSGIRASGNALFMRQAQAKRKEMLERMKEQAPDQWQNFQEDLLDTTLNSTARCDKWGEYLALFVKNDEPCTEKLALLQEKLTPAVIEEKPFETQDVTTLASAVEATHKLAANNATAQAVHTHATGDVLTDTSVTDTATIQQTVIPVVQKRKRRSRDTLRIAHSGALACVSLTTAAAIFFLPDYAVDATTQLKSIPTLTGLIGLSFGGFGAACTAFAAACGATNLVKSCRNSSQKARQQKEYERIQSESVPDPTLKQKRALERHAMWEWSRENPRARRIFMPWTCTPRPTFA